jgi:DNA (cytosine-5)-methyltransferase 1
MNKIAYIDLFCGAGGTTTGVERAKFLGKKAAKVIACVNHDPVAIASHNENHKGVLHFVEDIRVLDLTAIIKLVVKYRAAGWKIALGASLECTNFSNAKGGQPRNADSRTLAEHLIRYIIALAPDYIFIENVVEFMSWGPLNDQGKPLSRDKGKDYLKWLKSIKALSYKFDHRILNSADYGAHTSRKRFFGIFAKPSLPIVFPSATHSKNPSAVNDLFSSSLKKWKPVKEVLDLHDEGNSIFMRSKDLSEKTLARIHAGLIKYVAGGKDLFIAKYYSGRPAGKVISLEGPAGTITCVDGQSLVKANFMLKYNSTNKKGIHTPPSLDEPCPVIATQNRLGIISTDFLAKYYSSGVSNHQSVNAPAGSLTTKDRLAKVSVTPWLDKQYTGPLNHQSIDKPAGTIMNNDKHCLITPKINKEPWVMSTHYSAVGNSIHTPTSVITANRKWHYIVNPSWFGNPGSIDQPCCVIVARQDKSPLYLLSAITGEFSIPVYDTDNETMIKIKEFMAMYGIVDIKMRMLKVPELLKIQGFPDGYILKGNQQQQKKFIGNSVVPIVKQRIIECIVQAINEQNQQLKAA